VDAFQTHRGIVAALNRANVDTDQIIPKQFLKSIKRTGFGESLFFDWRYLADGKPDPDFELNAERFRGASILVAGNNFGCGSSREHAVWAIAQYGFKAVIAPTRDSGDQRIPGFADIFRNNAVKNGLLTIELSESEVDEILKMVDRFPELEATADLEEQRLVLHLDEEESFHFDVDPAVKETLTHGLDDIAMTEQFLADIKAFETSHDTHIPAG